MSAVTVSALYTYPVKGLSPQPLDTVALVAHGGFPLDREFALARPSGEYRSHANRPFPKHEFFMLAKDERLAGLTSHLAEDGRTFTVAVRSHEVLRADLATDSGKSSTEAFFGRVLDCPADALPVLAHDPGRRFTDVSVRSDAMMNSVSIINLASVRALESEIGAAVDPLRFRANIYLDGLEPFAENELVGKSVRIGSVQFAVVLQTRRCAATEVNPTTARRDIPVPRILVEKYGADRMGIYAEATSSGALAVGDAVTVGGRED